jgi:hypothetical protein
MIRQLIERWQRRRAEARANRSLCAARIADVVRSELCQRRTVLVAPLGRQRMVVSGLPSSAPRMIMQTSQHETALAMTAAATSSRLRVFLVATSADLSARLGRALADDCATPLDIAGSAALARPSADHDTGFAARIDIVMAQISACAAEVCFVAAHADIGRALAMAAHARNHAIAVVVLPDALPEFARGQSRRRIPTAKEPLLPLAFSACGPSPSP